MDKKSITTGVALIVLCLLLIGGVWYARAHRTMENERIHCLQDAKAGVDLVFITTRPNADSLFAPLTALVTPYFGCVVINLPSDTIEAAKVIKEMVSLRHAKQMTWLYTPETQYLCAWLSRAYEPQMSLSLCVDDMEAWTHILPDYMQSAEAFYTDYVHRLDLLRSAPLPAEADIALLSPMVDGADYSDYVRYFRLDTLFSPEMTTFSKAVAIGQFVSQAIPHANQTIRPQANDAITLWNYTKTVEPGFNCRYHSLLTLQLLRAVGIEARVLTCLPQDSTDCDCHVVNIVYLPELHKWAMLDTDQGVVVTDREGTPLSPIEMRECYVSDKPFMIWYNYSDPSERMEYYRSYMAKNTYWFTSPTTLADTANVYLCPQGFTPF